MSGRWRLGMSLNMRLSSAILFVMSCAVARAEDVPPCSQNPHVRCWIEAPQPARPIDPFDGKAQRTQAPPLGMSHAKKLLIAGGVLVAGSALGYAVGTLGLFGQCPGCGDGGLDLVFAIAGYSIAALEDIIGISLLIAGGVETARDRRPALTLVPAAFAGRDVAGVGLEVRF